MRVREEVGSADARGVYAEFTPATYAGFAALWRTHGAAEPHARFVHLGCGMGKGLLAAGLLAGVRAPHGIEWNAAAAEYAAAACARAGVSGATVVHGSVVCLEPPSEMCGRVHAPPPPDATHLYFFDESFHPRALGGAYVGDARSFRAMVDMLNACPAWRMYHTFVPLTVWRDFGLCGDVEQVAVPVQGRLAGSGRCYASYLLLRRPNSTVTS